MSNASNINLDSMTSDQLFAFIDGSVQGWGEFDQPSEPECDENGDENGDDVLEYREELLDIAIQVLDSI